MTNSANEEPMPRIIRLLGGKWRDGKRAWRMEWGELSISKGIAAQLCLFEDGFSLNLNALRVNVFIKLPLLRRSSVSLPSALRQGPGSHRKRLRRAAHP